jgi:peptidyl-prolyl cis-trans isomerase C
MMSAEAELNLGVPFREVAERYSDCGGKIVLGWIKRGEMVAPFEHAVFATPKGERSAVFRTVFGFHIVSILDHKPAGYQTFEEVRADLSRQALQLRRERRIRAEVDAAMRLAKIVSMPVSGKTTLAQEVIA